MGLGCTKHVQVPAHHCQHREELGHVWCFLSPGPSHNPIPKTPQQPPFLSGTQKKLCCSSCLSNSCQAGLVLMVGLMLPGVACPPSHHPHHPMPVGSHMLGAPSTTCTLYQLEIDLGEFMASVSRDTFTTSGSFPQMMSFMVIIYFNFFMIQEANGTGTCRNVKGQTIVLPRVADLG